jgi:lipid II:glycine glycyltransferase (peptidoglycan interpeptide bridge formation enzyme)
MNRYVGIIYNYFMDTGNFNVFNIEANNYGEAIIKCAAKAKDKESTFNHTAYKVIEFTENETCLNTLKNELKKVQNNIRRARKLSWKERLTGTLED